MTEEFIIRSEAGHFFQNDFSRLYTKTASEIMQNIKLRLLDFYSPESKSIFLNEFKRLVENDIKSKDDQRELQKIPKLPIIRPNRHQLLLFYIQQEINTLPLVVNQNKAHDPKVNRDLVFLSYSHNDKNYLDDIKRHFKPLSSEIEYWDDSKIDPGKKWLIEIRKAIKRTKVAILLISTDFLGSEFINTEEIPKLLEEANENGAVLISVILKPCLYSEFPLLSQFQALNSPEKTVLSLDELEKEKLYVNLVRQTKKSLNETEDDKT